MNFLIMGLPGAGKGTQAELITKKYNVSHVSTGDIFRQAIELNTILGQEAKKYLDSGELVPDKITIGIIEEKLGGFNKYQDFLLDGFPRSRVQAEALEQILTKLDRKIDCCLYIDVAVELLSERLSGRRICRQCGSAYHLVFNPPANDNVCNCCGGSLYQRDDDNEETVKARLEINSKQITPILDFYGERNVLVKIDGDRSIDAVFSDIEAHLTRRN